MESVGRVAAGETSDSDMTPGRGAVPRLALAAILAVAAVPRVLEALRNPLSFEEIYIVFLARTGLVNTVLTLAHDVDQPLFHSLLTIWRRIGGESELWIKSLSILIGLATILVVFALGRRLFGTRAGLFAALLLSTNPTHIYFSQHANVEVLLWLLLPLAAWRAVCWWERPSLANGMWFALAAAASLYTYYFAIFILLALLLWGLVRGWAESRAPSPERARPSLWAWLGLFAFALALFTPQLPVLVGQFTRDPESVRKLPLLPLRDVVSAYRRMINAPRLLTPVLALFAFVPVFSRRLRIAALLPLMVLVVPVAIVFTLSQAGVRIFFQQQLLYGTPFAPLAIGAGLAMLAPRPLGIALVLVLALLGLRAWRSQGPLEESFDLSRAGNFLATHARRGDLILACEPHAMLFMQYHHPELGPYRLLLPPEASRYHVSDGILAVPDSLRETGEQWDAERARGRRWWAVRVEHFPHYRDGAEAAARVEAARGSRVWSYHKSTVWSGQSDPEP
jgi:hypothetical protein